MSQTEPNSTTDSDIRTAPTPDLVRTSNPTLSTGGLLDTLRDATGARSRLRLVPDGHWYQPVDRPTTKRFESERYDCEILIDGSLTGPWSVTKIDADGERETVAIGCTREEAFVEAASEMRSISGC